MNNPITDQELDSFFDWLKPKLPKPRRVACPPPPAISQELLDMARQTALVHQQYIQNYVLLGLPNSRKETLRYPEFVAYIPATRAAADGKAKITPPPYDGNELRIGETEQILLGEYTVACEDLPFDPDYQQLVFECSQELLDKLVGMSVEIVVNDIPFKLEAVIGRRGLAKGKIPRNLDLSTGYAVHFYTPLDEGETL